jgi:hypothetical protein
VREGEGHHRDQRAIAQADEGGHVDRVEQFACMFACEYRGLAGLDDVLRSAHGMRRIRCKNRAKKGPAGIS